MVLQQQYELVKASRQILLNYCRNISSENFLKENSAFGRGSIRNLLVHIGNIYELWIAKNALKEEASFTSFDEIKDLSECFTFFNNVDQIMERFFKLYSDNNFEELEVENSTGKKIVTVNKLFLHVITHEFHHKGQILSLSRHLGYTPVDTDVIR
ncbi:MAG TPA: DinB family protein [Cytophagales bacterium]|nr:DinB family protein [Cytophagales bacterium]